MLFATIGQIHVFFWMLGAGLLVGALYALCAWLRGLMCAGLWLTLGMDALFGLGAALILIAATFAASYGQMRVYEFLGAAVGAILFELGVRPILRAVQTAARRALHRVFDALAKNRLIKVIFR